MDKENLFKEFTPVSPEQWKEKITADLKGADYDRTLVWKTEEGFEVQPFYTGHDLKKHDNLDVCPGDFPFLRNHHIKGNPWLVRQDIKVKDITAANSKSLDIRMKGIDSLGLIFPLDYKPTEPEIEKLLQNIRLDLMEINYETSRPQEMLQIVNKLAIKYNRDLEKVSGSLSYDPLGYYSKTGQFHHSYEEDMKKLYALVEGAKDLRRFQVVTVNAADFHNAGSGIITQLAFALARGADYLTYLTGQGLDIDLVAPAIRFTFAVGSNYFMEMAKFRAARYLWANIVNAYGLNDANNAAMYIHCENSTWNKSVYDPYVNMLRVTTETMSSLLGGVDSMTVLPFNASYEEPTDFSERIARNLQLLLRGESYFDKVNDPAAGSYYIEELTASIIREAWKLFLEVDERGGYYEAFREGFIAHRITEEANAKDHRIAQGRRTILGTNKYPNLDENLDNYTDSHRSDKDAKGLIVPYRGAMAFEALRYKTDQYAKQNKRPVVWMLTYGHLAMRNARSQFAGNFFGCAGFEIVNNPGFQTVDAGIEEARKSKPDIVVICSSDKEYEQNVEKILTELEGQSLVVLAGKPKGLADELKKRGFENFIHMKSDILQELDRYQQLLNIA
ncbi:MAG: methylmalonyl-CoA mutase family protein [bacterium]